MARSYAQFSTSMWRNVDFVALPYLLKMVYMLLSSQPDVSAVGVLHLSVTRWAGKSPDTTPEDINWALDGLAARRFIVIDRASEEVLIRAFLRWDNGYKNPKRQPAIRDAANEVESRAIVSALTAEFDRIDLNPSFRGQCSTSVQYGAAAGTQNDTFSQVEGLSDSHTDSVSASERRVPQPTTHNPQPVPPSADGADASSEQAAFAGMPEPDETAETPEQIGYRLARRWKKIREEAGKPIIARGGGKNKDDVIFPLKNLIKGAAAAGYDDDEINEALVRCDEGIPTSNKFDQTLAKIRDEKRPGVALTPFNAPHVGANSAYAERPPQQRSTSSQRAADILAIGAELDRQLANGATR